MSHLVRIVVPALALVTGCAAMMKGATPEERPAENPLVSGRPLVVTSTARIGTAAEADCSIWPFENSLSVDVTDAQICITMHKNVDAPPGWSGEPTQNRSEFMKVQNQAMEGGMITITKAKASKVGKCYEPGYRAEVSVWAFDYTGCAPNNGTITKTSTSLRVGDEAWSFAPPAGAQPQTPEANASTPGA